MNLATPKFDKGGILYNAIRLTGAVLLAAGVLAGTAMTASAAVTPRTADIVCSQGVELPAKDRFTVVLPATTALSSDCFLVNGDSSSAVRVLQDALRLCNGQTALKIDGNFGAKTEAAVKAVQKAHGISQDGGYGNQTRGVMMWPDNNSSRCAIPSHF
jgi:hypothetical protein